MLVLFVPIIQARSNLSVLLLPIWCAARLTRCLQSPTFRLTSQRGIWNSTFQAVLCWSCSMCPLVFWHSWKAMKTCMWRWVRFICQSHTGHSTRFITLWLLYIRNHVLWLRWTHQTTQCCAEPPVVSIRTARIDCQLWYHFNVLSFEGTRLRLCDHVADSSVDGASSSDTRRILA